MEFMQSFKSAFIIILLKLDVLIMCGIRGFKEILNFEFILPKYLKIFKVDQYI